MPTYRAKGIVIKKIDFAEADRILTIFTDTMGKVRAVSKGVRRTSSKMGGHLEIFNVVDLMLAQGRNLETVTSVQTINNFSNISRDLNKTSLAYYFIELVDKLTPDEHRDTRIFNLLVKSLKLLNDEQVEEHFGSDLLAQTFKLKLLQLLGYEPQLVRCTQCSEEAKEGDVFCFSNLLGGIVCHNCTGHDKVCFELRPEELKILRVILRADLELILRLELDDKTSRYINDILDNYIRHLVERESKSLGFLKKVERLKSL